MAAMLMVRQSRCTKYLREDEHYKIPESVEKKLDS